MVLRIPDEALREAGLTEQEALVEFAARLYDAGLLTLWSAAKMAALTRAEFEQELTRRRIAVYRPGLADLEDDLATLHRMGV